jgi:DNA-binding HxlR family transcriptional regulator
LEVPGARRALPILRDLRRLGPQRYQDFEHRLPGIAPNTLSARLKSLQAKGVIGARLYEDHPPRYEYFLTEKGEALRPVLKALYAWGEAHA